MENKVQQESVADVTSMDSPAMAPWQRDAIVYAEPVLNFVFEA